MKLTRRTGRSGERGLATLIMFILLVLVSACVAANLRTLSHLKAELRLIEERQQESTPREESREDGAVTPDGTREAAGSAI